MCGIVFINHNTEMGRATKRAFRMYKQQERRGKQGYGCVVANNTTITGLYRSQDEAGIMPVKHERGNLALFHHRLPTSTPNLEECTHPIYVSNDLLEYDYYVVHNGVITNAKELKDKHERLGFEYTTTVETVKSYKTKQGEYYDKVSSVEFNDSESLAIDLALAIERGEKTIESKGSIAFVVLQVQKNGNKIQNVFFGRNLRNPLKMLYNNNELVLSSDGIGIDVKEHTLYTYDIQSRKIVSTRDLGIDQYVPTDGFLGQYTETSKQRTLFGKEQKIEQKEQKEKNDRLIVTSAVRLYYGDGTSERVEFKVQGDYIYKTDILWVDADKLHKSEWTWYQNVMKAIDTLIADIVEARKNGLAGLVSIYETNIKKRVEELKLLSRIVNERPIQKG